MHHLDQIRIIIRQQTHAAEKPCVEALLASSRLSADARDALVASARDLVVKTRNDRQTHGTLDAFLHEFGLSNKEGIALMCLAESLLRVPDSATADALIAEKIRSGEWENHSGHSPSLFVNASTWGLMLTGKIIQPGQLSEDKTWYHNMLGRLGEPLVRRAMLQAMNILGGHYVLGRTIGEALERGQKITPPGTRFSFDMLGEGARTQTMADNYYNAYRSAIETIGKGNPHQDAILANGISIKLSALHPRYTALQAERVKRELLPRVLTLAKLAKSYHLSLSLDAEEASRLDLSLDIFQQLAEDPQLAQWQGLGFVLQAYQKRAVHVAEWLIELARQTERRIMVRLVKGAYWDYEIKYAQEQGYEHYPVFTRKANTDLSYQICAQILLNAQSEIYPQFATHNAHTVTLVRNLAAQKNFELQRLHGMGEALFAQLYHDTNPPPVRVYAPVGAHRDLLPYLVRRLLENGANSSFVNRFMDEKTPVEELISDIESEVKRSASYQHQSIPRPPELYQNSVPPRENSQGMDLTNPLLSEALLGALIPFQNAHYLGGSVIDGKVLGGKLEIISPNNGHCIGLSSQAQATDIALAFASAHTAQAQWDQLGGKERANILRQLAALLQREQTEIVALISREAGRTLADALNELREAIDFCHYYAAQTQHHFSTPQHLAGPTGENNQLSLHGRGVFLCISPWNFPVAIFTGQIVAALGSGNSVVAKPAPQTPLAAHKIITLMHEAGVPSNVVHLVCGDGAVGAQCVADHRVAGVAFTGSTATAKEINLALAQRQGPIVPLIAETGGQNAMIVDSTALLEQVVDDVLISAFSSAGQRCSALRVIFVQDDIAAAFITMLQQACDELVVGDSMKLSTDIGPVIDAQAKQSLLSHITTMYDSAAPIYQYRASPTEGHFVGPHIFEIERLQQLPKEVFGPIVHIIRFKTTELDQVIAQINATGFGLTLGIHSRLENRASKIHTETHVGNTYVNRNMIGSVVGVNPFGGQGLSGTGPKAGGPHYLLRFATEKTLSINTVATGGNAALLSLKD